jgi:hypothetical protein
MNVMSNETTKELGEAPDLTVDAFLRTVVAQMFENDNDTSYLDAKLKATDGSESDLKFQIRIISINGVNTRDVDEDINEDGE